MSDEHFRPTYTSREGDPHGSFNPTQVRLYGIPGISSNQESEEPRHDDHLFESEHDFETSQHQKTAGIVSGIIDKRVLISIDQYTGRAGDMIKVLKEKFVQFQPADSSYVFITSKIKNFMLMLGGLNTKPANLDPDNSPVITAGVIFGYAYEGHVYDFPKPKIMLIPASPEKFFPYDDSAYARKKSSGYAVWIVDKLDQCIEFELNQGFIEQLVLEANLPGKRAPTSYAGRASLGHRSGKLGE